MKIEGMAHVGRYRSTFLKLIEILLVNILFYKILISQATKLLASISSSILNLNHPQISCAHAVFSFIVIIPAYGLAFLLFTRLC